ncbi:MAG TPA: nuclear transport factor 2 family protein, partial [Pelagibacterales bacterium]|nr:nuclear transport factor 2 family protein [Pelagibacterales bacterium]
MKGFAKQFKNLPDYILKITYQIWEDKDVEAIRDYYADTPIVSLPTPTRSPAGVIYGAEPVIKATYATLKMFPDRQLLAEDVIWIGNDEEGYLSSHRILSRATHLHDGAYGKATGKKLVYRGIADCACKNNQVYDEWLVKDEGAIVRQLGIDPKQYASNLITSEGGPDNAVAPFNEQTPCESLYKSPILPKSNPGQTYAEILKAIMSSNKEAIEKNYDRAIQQFQPGGFVTHG